jgi:hypothetical protein
MECDKGCPFFIEGGGCYRDFVPLGGTAWAPCDGPDVPVPEGDKEED